MTWGSRNAACARVSRARRRTVTFALCGQPNGPYGPPNSDHAAHELRGMAVQYILTPVPSPAWTTPRYARNGDTHIGFTTMGEGPPDLVQVGIALGQVEMWHEFAPNRRAL